MGTGRLAEVYKGISRGRIQEGSKEKCHFISYLKGPVKISTADSSKYFNCVTQLQSLGKGSSISTVGT